MHTRMLQKQEPIAIIGSACRFPGGSTSPSKLWELLRQPRDVLRPVPPDRFCSGAYYHADPTHHGTSDVQSSYFLDEDISVFDHAFFQIPPSEADIMDPQQRILLETVYDGLCDAGLTTESLRGSPTSVFVGQMSDDWNTLMTKDTEKTATYTATGVARSITANRISYFFDWRGPSVTIDTACSSSLVAVHQAVQTLLSGESRVAVAAGSNLILSPVVYIAASNLRMLSSDGRCRMWDADAKGYGRGEGVAAVFLKPLSAALEDGDHIEGVIRATGVNQDGRTSGLMMPSGRAQAELIKSTYARAGLDLTSPEDRPHYFQAHGTGTAAGDTQEAEAIAMALFPDGNPSPPKQKLLVGSVKTIIGHTEGTAGLASLIASSQALRHGVIPPNMLFDKPNPRIEPLFEHLEVPTTARSWPAVAPGQPRRVSINSFGFGGTNAHVILESFEPPPRPAPATTPLIVPFVFSASSEPCLVNLLRDYLHFCQQNPGVQPRDLAWTMHARRTLLPYRIAIAASSINDLSAKLEDFLGPASKTTSKLNQRYFDKPQARVWAVFTGQGAQWPRMGAGLVEASDFARGYIARLDEVLASLPAPDRPSWTLHDELLADPSTSRVAEAGVAQPLCTAIQIVLVNLLRLAGVRLHCVVGHSSGEIGAAYASGLLSEEEAIRVAYYRGRLATLAGRGPGGKRGAMLAVRTSLEEVEALGELEMFHGRVQMAAHNSPSTVVLSGDEEAVDELAEFFQSRRTVVQKLNVDTAYHSHHVLPCAEPYAAALGALEVQTPTDGRPVWYSSSRPSVKMDEQTLTSQYWVENMTSPVRFFEAVAHALDAEGGPDVVLEFGPHPALRSAFASSFKNITGRGDAPPYHGLLSRGQDDTQQLSSALGGAWRHLGAGAVDFDALDRAFSGNTERKRVVAGLPRYPFDHGRSFGASCMSRVSSAHIHGRAAPHPLLGRRCFDSETTHQVTWRNILHPAEVPWLSGHQLQGQVVFPLTAYVAMAVDAVMLLLAGKSPPSSITVEDVAVERAIVFGDEEAAAETLFTVKLDRSGPATALAADFACYSSLSNDAPMVRNARGRITAEEEEPRGDNTTEAPVLPGVVPGKETYNLREVTADRFYASLAKLGYEYQGPFHGIRSIRRKLGYAEGEILLDYDDDDDNRPLRGPSTKRQEEGQLLLVHPGLMDSALQTISAASSCPGDGLASAMKVPTRIDRLVIDPRRASSSSPLSRHCSNEQQRVVEYACLVREETLRRDTIADVYLSRTTHDGGGGGGGGGTAETFIQIEGVHIKPISPSSADDDEVMFSEFVYGPYEPDGAVITAHSVSERVDHGVHCPLDSQSAASRVGLAQLARQLAHRYPRQAILEVAGGRGETAREVISALGSAFSSYTFTDASSDLFRGVRDRVGEDHAGGRLSFQTFDAQKPPTGQGFAGRSFDLVIAADVPGGPSAGAVVATSLGNIRTLLKPGGRLLCSVSSSSSSTTPDDEAGGRDGGATAKDVILSQWDARLQSHGFSGVDTFITPTPRGLSSLVVFATQAVDERVSLLRNPLQRAGTEGPVAGFETLTIIGGKTGRSRGLVEELAAFCTPSCKRLAHVDSVERLLLVDDHDVLLPTGSSVLCVTDLDEPLLKNATAEKLDALKLLFQHARNVLWVCQGARGGEPYSAMMFGLGRTIRAEYSNVNLQVLDVASLSEATASTIASVFLRLQTWDAWAGRGAQGDVVWSVERELVVEQGGRVSIPRLYPKKSSNLRYNTARRSISSEVDPQKVPVQLARPRQSSSPPASSPASPATPVPHEIPELRVPAHPLSPTTTVRVTHSLVPFIRVGGVGSVMLCAGTDTSTGAPVFGLSFGASSPAPTVRAWAVPQSGPGLGTAADGLGSLASSLVAQQILACASAVGTLLVHEADPAVAAALRRGANARGIRLVLTSSKKSDELGENVLRIHPKLSRCFVQKVIPRSTSVFVDLSMAETEAEARRGDVSSLIRSCLPQNSDVLRRSRFYSSEVQVSRQSAVVQQGHAALQAAAEAVSSLLPANRREPIVVPLSKMATTDEPSPYPVVLDWTEATTPIEMLPVDEGTIFRPDKTYVLVGLAGELGQSFAEWMVHRGARNIVLSSRHPAVDPKFVDFLSREWGAVIKVLAFDVTNRDEVHASFATIQRTMPPVAGVANGAMVLRDGTFETMTLADWQACVRPKVEGTRLLDELFRTTPLDFFVTFSSLAAVVGNMGQANYAAANAFLAALCAGRRDGRGVAGSTMDISSVVGLGVVERSGAVDAEYFAGLGFRNIAETDLHQLFAEAIVAGRPGCGEAPEIVTGIRPMFPEEDTRGNVTSDPRFGHFVKERADLAPGTGNARPTSTVPTRLLLSKAQTFREAEQIIRDSFMARLRRTLRADKMVGDTPLSELGLDSLTAVELRNWFSKELDVHVPVMRILSDGGVNDLVSTTNKVNMIARPAMPPPQTDLETVVQGRNREWHFHIYFLLQSPTETAAALALRDAVLRLRRDGAFVAVPLFRVNEYPMGPHPAGSYEIWVPDSSFSDVFFYLSTNRGDLSVLVHPLTPEQRRDHEARNAWMGKPWPLYLDSLPRDGPTPLQYPELGLGWSTSPEREVSLEERRRKGAEVEKLLAGDAEAAPAPED